MNNILSEKEYQKYILKKLAASGYEVQPADHYNRLFAVSRPELMRFLETTQPDEMESLKKIYKEKTEEVIVSAINAEETKKRGSRLDVLKHGVEIANVPLKLMYAKPATTYNKELNKLYHENIFSVSEEVWASDEERIDLVVFLNGLAIMAFELKCNAAGQNYENAILQYRTERNPKTRLFRFKAGVLVSFAMDLEEVYMTTKLDGEATFFLPFNMGKEEGINTGAGNPILKDEYSVHYMWDNILQKDSVLEIISKFMFIEVKEKKEDEKRAAKEGRTPRKKISETVIFPRFHQLDVIRKVLDDVMTNKSSQNYLLQHSAGSGKTNEIAWLSYRLASLHDDNNEIILTVKHFVRFYEFLIQASCFEDKELHKKYNFLNYLKLYLKMGGSGGGFNLAGKIKASGFVQKKKEEHKTDAIKSDPVVKLPTAEQIALTPQKTEKLSQIIAEINSKTGKSYDNDVAVKAMLQIKDIMMKSEELKASAKNNTEKDFEFAYFDNIDDALIEGLNQNQDFFSLLLGNDEIKKEVLGIFAEEIYRGLRAGK